MTDQTQQTQRAPKGEQPTADDAVGLYRRAFAEFGSRALWNITQFDEPTAQQMLAITRQLRTEGNMAARRLAEQIETAANLSARSGASRAHL